MNRSTFFGGTSAILASASLPRSAFAASQIRIATPPITVAAQPYFARATGIFAKAGLDSDVSFMQSGAAIVAAVVSGSLEFGDSNLISLLTARARNVPVTIVASDSTFRSSHPSVLLITLRQSPIQTARDLQGKTVAVNALKTLPHLSAMAWIDKNGGDSSGVRFTEFPIPAVGAALTGGHIDAAVISEPFLSQALQTDCRALGDCYGAIAKEFTYGAFFVSSRYAEDHREQVLSFREAILAASRWANAHRAEAAAILLRDAKLDVSALKSQDVYAEHLDPALMQPQADVAATYGLINKGFSINDMIFR